MFMKVFLLVSTIVGTYVGAGFMSGKEISVYLTRFGFISLPLVFLCCVAFYFLMKKCMNISCELKSKNLDFSNFLGERSFIVNLFVCFSALITIGGTLSGSRSVAITLFNGNYYLVQIITILLAFFVCVGGLKKIGVSNAVIVPSMIIYLLFIVIKRLNIWNIGYSIDYFCNNYFVSVLSFIFYLCSNFFMLGILLIQIGHNYSKKEIKLSAFISSLLLFLMIFAYCLTLLICGESVVYSEMPLIVISLNFGKVYHIASSIILWLALLTTLISCVFVASNYISRIIKNKTLCVFVIMLIGFLISLFGFSFVVSYLYAVIGIFGIVFLLLVLVPNKKSVFSDKFQGLNADIKAKNIKK